MRVQWNQLGCTEKNYLPGMKQSFRSYHSGYICPHCGLELFGEWNIFDGVDYLEYFASDVPEYKQEAARKKVDEANKIAIPENKKMQEEAVAFSLLKECPCCGGLLEHEPMFFIQVETVWCGGDWERDNFFFKNNVCHYAPNWSILGTDAALQAIWKVNTVDNMFDYLHEQQQGIGEKKAVVAIAELSDRYDTPLSVKVNQEEVSIIKSDSKKLQEYFLKIINIEKNIHSIKQRLFFLFSSSYKVNQEATLAQFYPLMSEKQHVYDAIDDLNMEFRRKSNEITELKQRREYLSTVSVVPLSVAMPIKPIEPTKPVYATANLFNKKKIAAENDAKTEKYNAEVALYNKALLEYSALLDAAKKQQEELREKAIQEREKEILSLDENIAGKTIALEEFKKEIVVQQVALESSLSQLQNNTDYPAVQLKINLEKEIATASEVLASLFKQKNQLYATEIIFGKYRDLAAITSFYEYLLSGRCGTLDGVNGCYNLYESELRANIIINKLDAIGDSLEQIKGNQYMLYSQLSQINTELSSLNATTTAMLNGIRDTTEIFLEHSAVIAHNSAVSAYYAKINAEIASSDRYISMICC